MVVLSAVGPEDARDAAAKIF